MNSAEDQNSDQVLVLKSFTESCYFLWYNFGMSVKQIPKLQKCTTHTRIVIQTLKSLELEYRHSCHRIELLPGIPDVFTDVGHQNRNWRNWLSSFSSLFPKMYTLTPSATHYYNPIRIRSLQQMGSDNMWHYIAISNEK